jgi:hypothetical protein
MRVFHCMEKKQILPSPPERQRCEAFSGLSILLVLSEFSKLFGG